MQMGSPLDPPHTSMELLEGEQQQGNDELQLLSADPCSCVMTADVMEDGQNMDHTMTGGDLRRRQIDGLQWQLDVDGRDSGVMILSAMRTNPTP
jgi:hypothetical protein